MNEHNTDPQRPDAAVAERKALNRRRFLGYAGALAGAGMVTSLTACNKKDDGGTPATGKTVNLGSGDVGILNYAYALEQLEAAFYTQVLLTRYTGMSDAERALLQDIRDHEVAHRDLFRTVLGGYAIPSLTPDFSSITFSDRKSVLAAAQTFEDLGVAAYNGAGKLIQSDYYLTLAGKIVSVEARHAATIRVLVLEGSFASLAGLEPLGASNTNALDGQLAPAAVLAAAGKFIKETINASQLPTT